MTLTTVECECGAKVIPTLVIISGDLLSYRLKQHICPICGDVIYTSGGGLREWTKTLSKVILLLLSFWFISYANKEMLEGKFASAFDTSSIALIFIYLISPALFNRMALRCWKAVVKCGNLFHRG